MPSVDLNQESSERLKYIKYRLNVKSQRAAIAWAIEVVYRAVAPLDPRLPEDIQERNLRISLLDAELDRLKDEAWAQIKPAFEAAVAARDEAEARRILFQAPDDLHRVFGLDRLRQEGLLPKRNG